MQKKKNPMRHNVTRDHVVGRRMQVTNSYCARVCVAFRVQCVRMQKVAAATNGCG